MKQPTGSLLVLDAGDAAAIARALSSTYPRAELLSHVGPEDLRRAAALLLFAAGRLKVFADIVLNVRTELTKEGPPCQTTTP